MEDFFDSCDCALCVLLCDPSVRHQSDVVVVETSVAKDVVVLVHELGDATVASLNFKLLQVLFVDFEFENVRFNS